MRNDLTDNKYEKKQIGYLKGFKEKDKTLASEKKNTQVQTNVLISSTFEQPDR